MDRESFILPGILIVVVLIILVLVVAFSGNNTFQTGKVSFQYPSGWSQTSLVGNFSNTSLYSEVIFTANIADSNGTSQPVSSLNVDNLSATQLGNFGPTSAEKVTIIQQNNYYYVITAIGPTYAINQTSTAYNMILKTLMIS